MPVTASLEDEDTLEGFQTYFQASDDLKGALPGGLRTGRLKAGVDEPPDPKTGRVQPYATIASEPGPRARELMTSGCKDFRKVTIVCYGPKADAIAAAALWKGMLSRQPYRADVPVLKIPNAALCGCIEIDGSAKLEQDTTTKKGVDVWKATVMFQVTTGRRKP